MTAGPRIQLCKKTDLTLVLKAIAVGTIYCDLAITIETVSTAKPEIKRRRQFRIRHAALTSMYQKSEVLDLVL